MFIKKPLLITAVAFFAKKIKETPAQLKADKILRTLLPPTCVCDYSKNRHRLLGDG